MPRASLSTDYLLQSPWCTSTHTTPASARYYRVTSSISELSSDEQQTVLSPNEIDEILSRKLYSQLQATAGPVTGVQEPNSTEKAQILAVIDPELILLVDRFFNLTYLNTIPMVNLLATAVATNFLKENIQELDNNLQDEQATLTLKRGSLMLYKVASDTEDDDNLSWASAPT